MPSVASAILLTHSFNSSRSYQKKKKKWVIHLYLGYILVTPSNEEESKGQEFEAFQFYRKVDTSLSPTI